MFAERENSKPKLQCKNGFGKEAVPEMTSPGPNGFVTPTRREELKQIICRLVQWITNDLAHSAMQPSAVQWGTKGTSWPTIRDACLTTCSSWSFLPEVVPPNQTVIPEQMMLSMTEWSNCISIDWLKPKFLSCVKKWRRTWHLLTIEVELFTHDRLLEMEIRKSTNATLAPLITKHEVEHFFCGNQWSFL